MIPSPNILEYISKGRNSTYRKVANNTYAVITEDIEGRSICGIQYHKTVIYAELSNGTIQLQNGGWRTVTTKSRLNEILLDMSVSHRILGREWEYGKYNSTNNVEFQNGLVIDKFGNITYDELIYIFPNQDVSKLTGKGWSEWQRAIERQEQIRSRFGLI